MRRKSLSIAALVLLIFVLDRAYRFLHPEVNLVRACLVGSSAFIVLLVLSIFRRGLLDPVVGGLSVFASAFLSVLLIQVGLLVSQSLVSGVVHAIILAAAYLALDAAAQRRRSVGV